MRIRAKNYLLEYHFETSLKSMKEMKEMMMEKFKVASDSEWKYIMKSNELVEGEGVLMTVFVSFSSKKDVYSTKLDIISNNYTISGKYLSVIDKNLALSYVLQFYKKDDILTNFDDDVITKHTGKIKVQTKGTYDCIKFDTTENRLTDKQRKLLIKHVVAYETELKSRLPDIKVLRKHLNNANNYIYKGPEICGNIMQRYLKCKYDLYSRKKGGKTHTTL